MIDPPTELAGRLLRGYNSLYGEEPKGAVWREGARPEGRTSDRSLAFTAIGPKPKVMYNVMPSNLLPLNRPGRGPGCHPRGLLLCTTHHTAPYPPPSNWNHQLSFSTTTFTTFHS